MIKIDPEHQNQPGQLILNVVENPKELTTLVEKLIELHKSKVLKIALGLETLYII
jgi:hypothetical protein